MTNNKSNEVKRVGAIGVIANLFLLGIKFIVGFVFKSQGLIADAINSFGDVFSSIVTFVGGKISSKPADEEHEFGHGKAEFVASLLIGIFMVFVSFKTIRSGFESILNKESLIFSFILLIVPVVTIIVKSLLFMYCKKLAKANNSLLLEANAKDHRNDILLSIGVLIGIIASKLGYTYVDGLVGIAISGVIVVTGITIIKEAFDVLIDKCIDAEIVDEMKKKIEEIPGVNHIDSIKSKPTGTLHMMIIKVSVNPDMTVRESHKIAGMIRELVCRNDNVYDAVVHINPDE
ncbi:MAG: cation transporter [Clostridia bacterium]|nr:cation transporter [Clostridia bacterium]